MPDYICRQDVFNVLNKYASEKYDAEINKAIQDIPTADVQPVVHCKDCRYWKPPHIVLKDGAERAYKESDRNEFGLLMVTNSIGINIGGKCFRDTNIGYADDKTVFRSADSYCSHGAKMDGGDTK